MPGPADAPSGRGLSLPRPAFEHARLPWRALHVDDVSRNLVWANFDLVEHGHTQIWPASAWSAGR
eukprot:2433455-Pyramimonas_sp.AAC.1